MQVILHFTPNVLGRVSMAPRSNIFRMLRLLEEEGVHPNLGSWRLHILPAPRLQPSV
jgi:hypothetical protein